MLACLILWINSVKTIRVRILAELWAFQLDKLPPRLISQDWAIFISECTTSGNLRRLLMSLSSPVLLKHCCTVTVESDRTVVWNRTQKWWILTKSGCMENIFERCSIRVFSATFDSVSLLNWQDLVMLFGFSDTQRRAMHVTDGLGSPQIKCTILE